MRGSYTNQLYGIRRPARITSVQRATEISPDSLAATGVLEFVIEADGDGSKIRLLYRVGGDPGLKLDGIAAVVDRVLAIQLERLARRAEHGR